MSSSFEQIVRPYQTDAVAPAELIPLPNATFPVAAQFSIGDGSIRTQSWSYSASTSIHAGHYKETSRTTDKIKVKDPNDESQYIEVQRAKIVKFQSTKNPNDKLVYEFKYPNAGNDFSGNE